MSCFAQAACCSHSPSNSRSIFSQLQHVHMFQTVEQCESHTCLFLDLLHVDHHYLHQSVFSCYAVLWIFMIFDAAACRGPQACGCLANHESGMD